MKKEFLELSKLQTEAQALSEGLSTGTEGQVLTMADV